VRDRFVFSAPCAGFVSRSGCKAGDPVAPGEVIAVLQPLYSPMLDARARAEAEARVSAAESRLAGAEAELAAAAAAAEYWSDEMARRQDLHGHGAASQLELDNARVESRRATALERSARFLVETTRHELSAQRTSLEYAGAPAGGAEAAAAPLELRSPVAGLVLAVFQESEGAVAAGASLIEVGDPTALEVIIEALSQDAVRMRPEMAVELTRWGGQAPLRGSVARIEPKAFTKVSALGVEEQRVLVRVELTSPAGEWVALGDGYRLEATVTLWAEDLVLAVPGSALVRRGDEWTVFEMQDGYARQVEVEIGNRGELLAEVRDGLREGARVIVHPDPAIRDGARVTPLGSSQK
jgi:HlyD family secretion protein